MKTLVLIVSILFGYSTLAVGQSSDQSDPPYGMSHLEAYSVFYDNFRTGDYQTALTFGEWMLEAKPRQIQGHRTFSLSNQFRRFITIYSSMAEEASDPSERVEYLERVVEIYDLAMETFDEDEIDLYDWTWRQGRFYQENHRDLDVDSRKAFEYYEKALEMDTQRFAEMSDGAYARILLNHYVSRGDREKALDMIDQVEMYAGSELSNSIENARDELFQDPEERITFLEGRLDEAEDREAALIELAELYDRVGDREKATSAAEELYELNPNFENTRTLADMALSNAEYEKAIQYLGEALDLSPNDSQKKRIAIEISETYQNIDDFQSARAYARRAIDIDSNFGEAYMRIASIYASTISDCTSGRSIEREDRTVYWLVLDYLDKAIEVDPTTRSRANRRIESYKPVMPTTEDKFFRGWETGESFRIDGELRQCYAWINETTTVR